MEIKSKFDHFNINVTNLERSIAFYEKALGLKEHHRKEASDGSFTLVYLTDNETGFLSYCSIRTGGKRKSPMFSCSRWLRCNQGLSQRNELCMFWEHGHGALFHQWPGRLLDWGTSTKVREVVSKVPKKKNHPYYDIFVVKVILVSSRLVGLL